MPIELLPVGLFLIGALIAGFTSDRIAPVVALLVPVIAAVVSLYVLAPGATASWSIMAYELQPVYADRFGLVMTGLFHLVAFAGALYAWQVRDRLQHAGMMLYIAGGIGAVLAGDLITLFVFFELIGLGGTLLVLTARTGSSLPAAVRYLVFQVAAGVTLLAGILILGSSTGDWHFRHIGLDAPGGWLILLAFGIKSGFPLLHNWITDAYPKASTAGLAVLVAVTTKVGVYGLARGFAGESLLVVIGAVLAFWPIFYTLVENNLRRVVAYAMMAQIGLMVVGIGVGSDRAIDGVSMHIVMDVLFKMTLFMALGVVLHRVGTTRADRLGGLWRSMPLTTACVAVAVAANAALPLTAGFISKKLLLSAIEYGDVPVLLWLALVTLSSLAVLYAGVRILWEGFLRPVSRPQQAPADAPWPMALAMLIPVTLLIAGGLVPGLTDVLRPNGGDYSPLYAGKIINQLQLLLFGLITYVLLARAGLGLPQPGPARWLDAEWFYRRGVPATAGRIRGLLATAGERAARLIDRVLTTPPGKDQLAHRLGQTWPTGSMALWVAVLLAVMLLFGISGE